MQNLWAAGGMNQTIWPLGLLVRVRFIILTDPIFLFLSKATLKLLPETTWVAILEMKLPLKLKQVALILVACCESATLETAGNFVLSIHVVWSFICRFQNIFYIFSFTRVPISPPLRGSEI